MGQTVDNKILNNMAQTVPDSYGYGSDFSVNETNVRAENNSYIDRYSEIVGYKYEHENAADAKANSIMENFEEYLKDMQERAKDAGEDAASREREAKEAAKEIARSLTGDEIKKLEMMGIDMENARLSDLMGIVNTMRGNAYREETKQLMAEISAENNGVEKLVVVGGSVKAAGTDIELANVDVTDIVAEENKKNVDGEKPAEEARTADFRVSNSELIYLLRNNLALNKDNLYKAHYSGSRLNSNSIENKVFEDMLPQIERVIEQAGYEADAVGLEGAKTLIANDIPVTADTMRAYMEFQRYAGKSVNGLEAFEDIGDFAVLKADKLYKDVRNISLRAVYDMAAEGRSVTIAAAVRYMDRNGYGNEDGNAADPDRNWNVPTDDRNLQALTAMRRMEEIRLSMTHEAAGRLIKLDINIDTRELSKVVAELKSMERGLVSDSLRNAGLVPSEDNINIYRELGEKVSALAEAPAEILAAPLKGAAFTVNRLYMFSEAYGEEGDTVSEEESVWSKIPADAKGFETVRRSYEAVGTAPRRDMGDSINKAFANVDDILRELDLDVGYENQRAVRILGYNSMEITAENIEEIVYYDRQVNDLMDVFYPEAVLGMIKDGINPLDVPIDELNNAIRERNYNAGVTEAGNFAAYLRDMESMGEVSPEERESYIGIYRMMDKLAKSGDREAGWIFANSGRLTVRNLISAMRSRRASGIDIAVNEDFGMLESAGEYGKRIDEQISSAFDIFKAADENVEAFMQQNRIEQTMVNYAAADRMVNSAGGIYQLVSDIMSKMKFSTGIKQDMVDEETGNMSDSLMGEDISVLESFRPESILESLRGSGEMSYKYEDLRNQLTQLMYGAGAEGKLSSMDMSVIRTINAGFNILSRMAQNDRYQVPVETEQGIKVMNLTVKHGDGKRGTIELGITGDAMGEVSAVIRADKDGILTGFVAASSSEGNYALMEATAVFYGTLSENGFSGGNIILGKLIDDVITEGTAANIEETEQNDNHTDTAVLYRASVALVKAVGRIIC